MGGAPIEKKKDYGRLKNKKNMGDFGRSTHKKKRLCPPPQASAVVGPKKKTAKIGHQKSSWLSAHFLKKKAFFFRLQKKKLPITFLGQPTYSDGQWFTLILLAHEKNIFFFTLFLRVEIKMPFFFVGQPIFIFGKSKKNPKNCTKKKTAMKSRNGQLWRQPTPPPSKN